MKTVYVAILVGALFAVPLAGHAVPPAYEGQFGNPEEPALRVVKWPWLGVRKLVVHTHEGLKSGIQCHPPAAVCEGAQGAARGTCILVDHTGRGMIYAKLPPKGSLRPQVSYEEQALAFLNTVAPAGEEGGCVPMPEGTVEVAVDENGNPYLPFKVKERAVSRAQRRYVPERTVQRDKAYARRENLLRLAR